MPMPLSTAAIQDVHNLLPLIVSNGLSVLGAIAILIVGLWLSGRSHTAVVKLLGKAPHLDQMLTHFLGGIVRYLILTITILSVLSQFGIQTTSLIAVLGAAGLAVGLALQGTLSNLAAGVMLLLFRPFKIGDVVLVGGVQGTVKELSLFWTELVTADHVQVVVPNSGVWGQPLRNFSTYPLRGFDVRFRIPEAADLAQALTAVQSLVKSDTRIVAQPAPGVALDRVVLDNALEIVVTAWTASASVGAVKTDMIKAMREALAREKTAG